METYFVIVSKVRDKGNGNVFLSESPDLVGYPTDDDILGTMERLRNKGYEVWHSKVEKRHKLLGGM